MDAIITFISEHPSELIMLIVFFLIIFLYIVFKKLIKIILVILLVLFAVGGFFFIKDPNNIKKTIDTIGAGVEEISQKSKDMYQDLKALFKKSKEVPGSIGEMLDDAKEQVGK